MSGTIRLLATRAALALLAAMPVGAQQSAPPRVIAIGGVVTEIVHALGAADRLVGVDVSSTRPAAAARHPRIGSARSTTAEALLGLRPTTILAASPGDRLPALATARGAGVRVIALPDATTLASVGERVRTIAQAVGAEAAGDALAMRIVDETRAASARQRAAARAPRVLVVYARGTGTLFAAGRDTEVHLLLELAGLRNAFASVEGFKPITAEAVAASGAEVLVFTESGLASVGGPRGALATIPGLALTPAGRAGRVVAFPDDGLLWMGPRLAEAVVTVGDGVRRALATGGAAAAR